MKSLPRVRASTLAAALPGFALILLPLLVLVVRSLLIRDFTTGQATWSLVGYRKLLEQEALGAALLTSLGIAGVSAVISTVLGTLAALALVRNQGERLARWMDAVVQIPFALPEIVMGLSLLLWFVFLNLTLGARSVVLAHVTFSISYVIMTVRSRLEGFDLALEDAARDLGAGSWQVFWRVTFPLILPAVISGALMAFTLSFDDFLITFFVAGAGTETLPIRVYSMIRFGVGPELNALSTVLVALTAVIAGLGFRRKGS